MKRLKRSVDQTDILERHTAVVEAVTESPLTKGNKVINALMYAKTAVIDGVWSTVGSTNLDYWSLLSDDEVNAVILNREFAIEMEKMFAKDIAESDQITWEEWEKRTVFPRMREWFAHLFSHWM